MIGKTLYKARVVEGEVKIFSFKIVVEQRKYYYFTKKQDPQHACYKTDVGVVIFLTKREALDYLIKNLIHSVDMGKHYLNRTKQQLKKAQRISREIKN
jgi:hypothetical protein